MSFFSKENFLALSAFGLSLGGYLFFKNNQKVDEQQVINEQQLDEVVERERVLNILKTIKYKMKYYHRLAQSINRQLEGKSNSEKETARKQFFDKFKENDYKVIVKNIAQYEFGVSYDAFNDSLDYYAFTKDEDIIKVDDEIQREFLQNLSGNKTLLAPSSVLLSNIDKQTAKEILKETYCFKFYQITQQVKEYLKTNKKIEENESFYKFFENIYQDIDQKLSSFLLVDKVSETERNLNCFFELLVYYCEGDLEYSGFIREMEIQSLLLFERIIAQNDDVDFKYIKNLFKNV